MRLRNLAVFGICIAAILALVQASEPKREAGLSAHLQPDRIGRLMGQSGGFLVAQQPGVKEQKLFPTADAFYAYFKTLSSTIQQNGLWIVTTNPAAYAESELKQVSALEELCKKDKTPLFVARGADLPNGWQKRN